MLTWFSYQEQLARIETTEAQVQGLHVGTFPDLWTLMDSGFVFVWQGDAIYALGSKG